MFPDGWMKGIVFALELYLRICINSPIVPLLKSKLLERVEIGSKYSKELKYKTKVYIDPTFGKF